MLTYKAMYKFLDDGVHGEVLDFAGVITCGKNLDKTRRLLSEALAEMAETNLILGESLPPPNLNSTNVESDLEEPIYLLLNASTKIKVVPELVYETA
jgi:predicted RNase H-like HicB family nuclease